MYSLFPLSKIKSTLAYKEVKYIDLNESIARIYDPVILAQRQSFQAAVSSDVLGISTNIKPRELASLQYDLFLKEREKAYGEWHLNQKGNDIVAQIITEELIQSKYN